MTTTKKYKEKYVDDPMRKYDAIENMKNIPGLVWFLCLMAYQPVKVI